MLFWIFAVAVGGSFHVRAETVLYAAPNAPELEYRAAIAAASDARTPSDAYAAHVPKPSAREHALEVFARAQSAFLEGLTDDARGEFKRFVEFSGDDDWRAAERELFAMAYLRLAQLEPENKTVWLKRALNWLVGSHVDTRRVPPPLVQSLEALRARTRRVRPRAIFRSSDWRVLLINGVTCGRQDCPEFFAGGEPVRVTYLSDRFLPVTQMIAPGEWEQVEPARIPWVTGTCEHPLFHPRAIGRPEAFWDLACLQTGTLATSPEPHTLSRTENAVARANLSSTSKLSTAKTPLNLQPVALAPDTLPTLPAPARSNIFKSKWFWAGVGTAVVAAVVLATSMHPKPDVQTTDSY